MRRQVDPPSSLRITPVRLQKPQERGDDCPKGSKQRQGGCQFEKVAPVDTGSL